MTIEQLQPLVEKKLSSYKIASILNVSQTTIRYWLKKHKLSTKTNRTVGNIRICTKCEIPKSLNEFYSKGDNGHGSSMCKICFSKYQINRWIQKKIDAIIYKGSKCKDCNISYPNEPYVIFDFHHLDPSIKEFGWGDLKKRDPLITKKELDKCILLCSNCHRKRHIKFVLLDGTGPTSMC